MITSAAEFVALRCSTNPDDYRRSAREDASEETWRQVIEQWPEMRRWVAHNKTIPESIVRELFKRNDEEVKFVLAMKRSTPTDILDTLATDESDSIRLAVARHPEVSKSTLELLMNDDWEEVRRIASLR